MRKRIVTDGFHEDSIAMNPFLPAKGMADNSSLTSWEKNKIYDASNLLARIHLPFMLKAGVMKRFRKRTSGNDRGKSYRHVLALCVLLETHAWDHPLFPREICDAFEITRSSFMKYRRSEGIVFTRYSRKVLANKLIQERSLPFSLFLETRKWWMRVPSTINNRQAVAAAFSISTSLSIDDLSSYFDVTKTSIEKAVRMITRSSL